MVQYEWDVEVVALEGYPGMDKGEVVDHQFCECFAELKDVMSRQPEQFTEHVPVLVRDQGPDRSWAYIVGGRLPTYFQDANGGETEKVPNRFTRCTL